MPKACRKDGTLRILRLRYRIPDETAQVLPGVRQPAAMKRMACKTVMILTILSLLLGFFGCDGGKKYTAGDIVLIHTAYYGMEKDPVYSFTLKKENGNWLFSARCLVGNQKEHYTSFSSFPITDEDAQGFLQIIGEEGEIERLRKYREPIHVFHISDASMRSSGITFSDGNQTNKNTKLGDKALEYLYELAGRYYEAAEGS